MKRILLTLLVVLTAVTAFSQTKTPVQGYPRFAFGADVSWTPYIERNGVHTYYKPTGELTNVTEMVSDYGLDAVRVRVWVNPESEKAKSGFKFKVGNSTWEEMPTYGTCSDEEMTALARRFARQGQRVMVSFHFSDQWADPARQFIPVDWAACSTIEQLSARAVEHVREVLTMMHDRNINVAWVQIGNETNTGMMKWNLPAASGQTVQTAAHGCEIGQLSNNQPSQTTYNFVRVFTDVAHAAREIYPDTKTVLHLTKTAQWSNVNWTLNLLKQAGFSSAICDYIGLSLYPGVDDGREDYTAEWQKYADLGIATINNISRTYGFRTLLCEVGMNNEWSESVAASDQLSNIRQCSKDVRAFTQYLISKLGTAESTCDGLFYWEPQTDYIKGYKKGACVALSPGSSWPRDKVTPNDWWTAIRENSTFPLGGLKEYKISDKPEPADDPNANHKSLYLYYYDTDNHYLPLSTIDGVNYTLTNLEAPQWFKFRIVTMDWTFAVGGVEVGLDKEVVLESANGWDAWTNIAIPASAVWRFNLQTNAFRITTEDTAIHITEADSNQPVKYFTLQGIRVLQPRHGIFIANGKKKYVR